MSRATREKMRLLAVVTAGFFLLAVGTFLIPVLLGKTLAVIILAPAYLVWLLLVAALFGAGPLARRLNTAAEEDAQAERKVLDPKQPGR